MAPVSLPTFEPADVLGQVGCYLPRPCPVEEGDVLLQKPGKDSVLPRARERLGVRVRVNTTTKYIIHIYYVCLMALEGILFTSDIFSLYPFCPLPVTSRHFSHLEVQYALGKQSGHVPDVYPRQKGFRRVDACQQTQGLRKEEVAHAGLFSFCQTHRGRILARCTFHILRVNGFYLFIVRGPVTLTWP